MAQIEFPIKTATSCILKWSWSTIFLSSATTTSCHRCNHMPLPKENFEDFHNLPRKLEDRKAMLAGQWPAFDPKDLNGCNYCKKIEDAGGMSDRLVQHQFPHIPHEHETDPKAIRVTPRLLEIYFTNKCNLACVYCHPRFSSKWDAENKRFAKLDQNPRATHLVREDTTFAFDQLTTSFKTNADYEYLLFQLWVWLQKNISHLYHL